MGTSGAVAAGGATVGAIGMAGRTSVEIDGKRVPLNQDGVGRVLRDQDGAKKLKKAVAAALGANDPE